MRRVDPNEPKRPIFIDGMKGLGDNLYQRAIVRGAIKRYEVWLATPWPQIYQDMDVRLVRTGTVLRTQRKNEERGFPWQQLPRRALRARVHYSDVLRTGKSILQAMEVSSGQEAVTPLDLLAFPTPELVSRGPYVVVRPATVRTEWANAARNPEPGQLAKVVTWVRALGYHVVSVADIAAPHEVLVEDELPADQRFERGELTVEQLLGLVRGAAAVVGPVGWIVPASLAYGVPAFIVLGGHGAYNSPHHLVDSRLDGSRFGWGMPDRHCVCMDMGHRCDKQNSRLREQFDAWASTMLPGRRA